MHGDFLFQVCTLLPPYLSNSFLTKQTAWLMAAGKRMISRNFFFFFLITIHKITHLSLPFILVSVLLFLHRIIKNGNHKKYSIAKCLRLQLHIHLEDSCNACTSFSLQQGISPTSDLGRWCHQTVTPAKQQLSRSLSLCTWCQPGARLCLELR